MDQICRHEGLLFLETQFWLRSGEISIATKQSTCCRKKGSNYRLFYIGVAVQLRNQYLIVVYMSYQMRLHSTSEMSISFFSLNSPSNYALNKPRFLHTACVRFQSP